MKITYKRVLRLGFIFVFYGKEIIKDLAKTLEVWFYNYYYKILFFKIKNS